MPDVHDTFRVIADSTYDWESWIDAHGVTRWINPAVTRITGYSVEECLALPDYPLALAHDADRTLLARVLAGAARGESGNDVEFRIVHKRGYVRWVAVSFQRVADHSGRTLGYRTSMRDVDERKRMEEELHALRRQAEALAQARSELLANVSHELRSPAHCIAGFVELLGQQPLTPEQSRYVELIADQSATMLRQVEDLLSLTALEAGGVELVCAPLDLRVLVASSLEGALPKAQARAIDLSAELSLAEPWVEVDALRLKQILQNLIDNALKFTDEGSVRIAVHDQPSSQPGGVTFEVRDTGIGMTADAVQTVLAPFRQGDGNRRGGVGLGLAIVDRLVRAMAGTLEISSSEGQGTTVRIQLPLPRAELQAPTQPPSQVTQLHGTALVVDDSAPARELLCAMLASCGLTALTAASAEQARSVAARSAVDLVFLDYHMPGSDGAQTAVMLRRVLSAREPKRRIPIYILTANVFARERLKEAAHTVDDILTKPLSRAALLRLLATVEVVAPARLDTVLLAELQTLRDAAGQALLVRLLPRVVADMESTLQRLQHAERAAYAQLAHDAAGHASTIGASAAAELARKLELAATSKGDDSTLGALHDALQAEWTQARAELEALANAQC